MERSAPLAMLFATGLALGLTLPLIRIAVSTGHAPLGVVLWQQAIMVVMMSGLVRAFGLGVRRGLKARHAGLFVAVAGFGTILPGYFTFLTAAAMPAGVRAILIAMVPMFVLPMALALGFERPDPRRALGVGLGAAAIVAIALPGAGLTPTIGLGVILLALISPLSYAIEGNFLAWRGSEGLHPFQVLLGASLVGFVLTWPLAAATGQTLDLRAGWGAAEWAILASGALNAMAYSGYVWLIGRAGAVFASQISYLVTGFGVVWSMILLGERYSPWVWAALALMMSGIALVQPRDAATKSP